MIHNQHQMSRHSYTAGEPWGRSHVEALAADHSELGARSIHVARSSLSPLITTGGGFGLRPFHSHSCSPTPRAASATDWLLPGLCRPLLPVAFKAGWSRANLRCASLSSRSRPFLACFPQHVSRQTSDAAEHHSSTPLFVVGFNANRHSEAQTQNAGNSIQGP